MFYRRNWIVVIIGILGLILSVPVAQAQRQEVDIVCCYSSTTNVVHFSPEASVMSHEGKAIFQSSHENKVFDNFTSHFVGTVKRVSDKWMAHTLCKHMGPDGDFMLWETTADSESGMTSKPIYGTGKWKGIKGETKGKRITAGKPIVEGTVQACERWVGWIEVPK